MGLDFVEIIIKVEDDFGVEIEDEDLFARSTRDRIEPIQRLTVGDLYDLILEKRQALDLPKGKIRPEVFAMRDVRPALAEVLQMSPEDFRPIDRLSRLLPLEDRRKLWRRLRKRLRGLGPLTSRPTRFAFARWTVFFVVAAVAMGTLAYLAGFRPGEPAWTIGWQLLYLACVLAGAIGLNTTWDCCSGNLVPREVRTVELLAKSHLARNRRHYIDECGASDTDEDVWHSLQIILVDVLGVEISKVTKEADVIRDLGAD